MTASPSSTFTGSATASSAETSTTSAFLQCATKLFRLYCTLPAIHLSHDALGLGDSDTVVNKKQLFHGNGQRFVYVDILAHADGVA